MKMVLICACIFTSGFVKFPGLSEVNYLNVNASKDSNKQGSYFTILLVFPQDQ